MTRIHWTYGARTDLLTCIGHIRKDNPDAAEEMLRLLQRAAESLARFPRKGGVGRIGGTRELVAHPRYILVYAILEDRIDILSVLHTSRQYPPD